MLRMMNEREYRLSIGKAWLNDYVNINDMIAVAESDMYEAKRLHYKEERNIYALSDFSEKAHKMPLFNRL